MGNSIMEIAILCYSGYLDITSSRCSSFKALLTLPSFTIREVLTLEDFFLMLQLLIREILIARTRLGIEVGRIS